jgi:hypothetical protein
VNVIDTDPEVDISRIPKLVTLQVDNGVGECFSLAFNKNMIWDPDHVEDPTDPYKHHTHTVQVT